MHPATEKLISDLKELSLSVGECDYPQRGYHYEIDLAADEIRALAECMLKNEMYLVFVGGLDVKPAPRVIYQFASFTRPCRVVVRAAVTEDHTVPTISDIFQGASWHERETRDFFGIVFTGHPYLRPLILAEEDVDLKPLLKTEETIKDFSEVSWAVADEASIQPEAEKPEAKKPEAKDKAEQG